MGDRRVRRSDCKESLGELGRLTPVAGAVQLHDVGAWGDAGLGIRLSHACTINEAPGE